MKEVLEFAEQFLEVYGNKNQQNFGPWAYFFNRLVAKKGFFPMSGR